MYPYPLLFGKVYLYGIMTALGLLSCFCVLYLYSRRIGVSTKLIDFAFYNGVASIAVGYAFAALWQAIYEFIENPENGFHFGGITVVGGLIGGAGFFLLVYFAFYRRRSKERLIHILPVIPCCILVAHAFGRVGCFFAGCCHGMRTDSIFGVKFPRLPYPVLPTQLYEAIFLFLMFGVCTFLLLRYKYKLTLPLYMFTYGIFRFVIEFFRDDDRGALIPGISPTQFWCILIVLGAIPVYILLKRIYAKLDATQTNETANG